MEGLFMLKSEVTEWNEPWSTGDRARIAATLEAIPDGKCVVPRARNSIGVWIKGRRALIIYPNYLAWPGKPGKRWTKDLPPDPFPDMRENEHDQWHLLSTFPDRGLGNQGPVVPPEAICPTHHIAIPINDICDECR